MFKIKKKKKNKYIHTYICILYAYTQDEFILIALIVYTIHIKKNNLKRIRIRVLVSNQSDDLAKKRVKLNGI